jgi:hypothetical protein
MQTEESVHEQCGKLYTYTHFVPNISNQCYNYLGIKSNEGPFVSCLED